MKVAVLGGGVVGVATAWWLRQAGFDVSVIERHPEVAAETSRYGGGLISVACASLGSAWHAHGTLAGDIPRARSAGFQAPTRPPAVALALGFISAKLACPGSR